jgi:YidC/Oxa1 family membrane protein insertase
MKHFFLLFWLDWLTLGFSSLYNFLYSFIANAGFSILALSLCVKIILHPLMELGDKWQRDVNRVSARLAPGLAAIKKMYKGEEQHEKTLALYREAHVSPFYTLKSVFGVAIQIPVFIAAYTALSASPHLAGVSFFGISDLAKPDHIIPVTQNFRLNLLPFLMSLFTILASSSFHDRSLSASQLKRQQINLYFMAIVFFGLLYACPAGVVLYWTCNNVLAWVRQLIK